MAEPKEPNAQALAAFIARKAEIDRLLEQLLTHSHEHLNLAPEEVHWGHVGKLDDWLACLRRVAKLAGILAQDAWLGTGFRSSLRYLGVLVLYA